jgi:hypothetical protein
MTPILDRLVPTDWEHVSKYPLQATTMPTGPMPVIAGTNWYREFDRPVYDESDRWWWVARNGQLTAIRGGHCYLLKQDGVTDSVAWWKFYDQGSEGACVGFGCARAMSIVDRKRFAAREIYLAAQRVDEWPGESYSGTSVRAGVDILRTVGASVVRGGRTGTPKPEHGIAVNRWATSMADIYGCLQSPRLERQGVVAYLNSWGSRYPHITYMPAEVFERLLREDGEATVFTPA